MQYWLTFQTDTLSRSHVNVAIRWKKKKNFEGISAKFINKSNTHMGGEPPFPPEDTSDIVTIMLA